VYNCIEGLYQLFVIDAYMRRTIFSFKVTSTGENSAINWLTLNLQEACSLQVPEAFFLRMALVGYFLYFTFFGLHMESEGRFPTKVQSWQYKSDHSFYTVIFFLHSSKWQPHSYSDLMDTWADSVCIHQLVFRMCSKAACIMACSN